MKLVNRAVALAFSLTLLTACSHKTEHNALTTELDKKVGNKVYFHFDSSAITPESSKVLAAQADFIKAKAADKSLVIEGHCDERGTREYNLGLGERRANATLKALSKHGITPEKMTVISFGKEKPAVEGQDEAAWAKNRRAVTVIN